MTKTLDPYKNLTPYQKWYKSWKPMSSQGRAAKRAVGKVWNWPPCQPPKPNNDNSPIVDLRGPKWTFEKAEAQS